MEGNSQQEDEKLLIHPGDIRHMRRRKIVEECRRGWSSRYRLEIGNSISIEECERLVVFHFLAGQTTVLDLLLDILGCNRFFS